jgi:eukaryotic-like serine/threonine-protein kinase
MPDDARETEQLSRTDHRPEPGASDAPEVGAVLLGRFKVVRLLGRGGMGEVYEARDLRLHATVALKMLRASLADNPGLRDRLQREVQLARAVTHPNVCRVFDFHEQEGPNGEPLAFVTMELLEGETLADRLRTKVFSPRDALPLLRQMAEGLSAIHAKSLVHRDFKPSNVMLVPDGESARAVVTDFGIARMTNAADDTGWAGTQSGAVLGSPAYMAPEQRSAGQVTPRTDVFALGLVACEMVSGVLPTAGALHGLPRGWRTPVRRALDPQAERRYQGPRQLVAELERPRAARVGRWLAGGLALLALALGGLLAVRAQRISLDASADRRSIAVLPWANFSDSKDDEYFSEGLAEDILTELAKIRGLHVISRTSANVYRGATVPLRQIARELGVGTVLEGSVQRTAGRVRINAQLIDARTDEHLWAETYDRDARDVLDVQRDVAGKVAAALALRFNQPDSVRLRRDSTNNPDAYDAYLRGVSQAGFWLTQDGNRAAMENLQKAVTLDPTYAPAHAELALAYLHQSDYEPSNKSWDDRAGAEAKRALELESELALPHLIQAWRLADRPDADVDTVLEEAAKAEALDPNFVYGGEMGVFFAHFGLEEQALRAVEGGLRSDPLNPAMKGAVLFAHELSGRFAEAVPRAEALYPKGEGPPQLCNSLLALHRLKEAELACGVKSPIAHLDQLERATLLASRGEKAAAAEVVKAVVGELPVHHRTFHHDAYQLALIEALLGNGDEAVRWLRTTVETGMPDYLLFSRDPLLDSIRSHPGFVQLMAELKPRWEAWRAKQL